MDTAYSHRRMFLKDHGVIGHDAVNPLAIDGRLIGGSPLPVEKGSDPPIAVGRPIIHEPANGRQQLSIVCLEMRPARLGLAFETLSKIGP
ncbi:hypothetical protein ABIA10_007328 [Rhizobium leguminosarum]